MGYLVDFTQAIENHDSPVILRLWEEYTSTDEVDADDFLAILETVKASDLADFIGRHIEMGIPIWELVKEGEVKDEILRLMVDLQCTKGGPLEPLTYAYLQRAFGSDPLFNDKMRIIGLRGSEGDTRGTISKFALLNHMKRRNFVFHTAGWGVGEIMDVSMIREELSLECDYAPGVKTLPFSVAFTVLIPLSNTHFLARRFGHPDELEQEARKDPLAIIRLLLKDLGPLSAAEIKDELCGLVIPEEEWNKWWQTCRTKIKKDTKIENPSSTKHPFRLLKEGVTHEERLQKALEKKPDAETLIQMVYSYLKDFSETLKDATFKDSLEGKLKEFLSLDKPTIAQELQLHFFLEDLTNATSYEPVERIIKKSHSPEHLIGEIGIQALKKRVLVGIKKFRDDWKEQFLHLLFVVDVATLREYILTSLLKAGMEKAVMQNLQQVLLHPAKWPEMPIWYMQKAMSDPEVPLGDGEGRSRLFEALLILLSSLENQPEKRDLVKKIQGMITDGRYQLVRDVMKEASTESVKEILLLVTKCHSLSEHDIQIFHSLAAVAHPSLSTGVKEEEEDEVIWTTQEGYTLLQKRIEQIGTVETVENAKEIEVARAHGDLRENAEFKAALERRDRLQSELKFLSNQLNKCRVLTKEEVDTSEVSVGTIVELKNEAGQKVAYTLLGPWDADPDRNILSFQSKLAKDMAGSKVGETCEIQGKTLEIVSIRSAL